MQRNWIGRSLGVDIVFDIVDSKDKLKVFTTRPDTLMGVTYVAVAAEHPLAHQAARLHSNVADFIKECAAVGTAEAAIEKAEKKGICHRAKGAGVYRQLCIDGLWRRGGNVGAGS